MGAGANQENGLSDAVVGGAVQNTRSSQSNQLSETTGGPNYGFWQSGSAERGGGMSGWHLVDMTVEQPSGRNYPVMGLDAQQVIPNGYGESGNVLRVLYSGKGAQQINGLPRNHEEELVVGGVNGLRVHRVKRACQASEMSYLDNVNQVSHRPHETAAGENLTHPTRDVTCSPVQERGGGYTASQTLILPPGIQPCRVNLVSSMGNAEKPTEHFCCIGELKQWNQQLKRQVARLNYYSLRFGLDVELTVTLHNLLLSLRTGLQISCA